MIAEESAPSTSTNTNTNTNSNAFASYGTDFNFAFDQSFEDMEDVVDLWNNKEFQEFLSGDILENAFDEASPSNSNADGGNGSSGSGRKGSESESDGTSSSASPLVSVTGGKRSAGGYSHSNSNSSGGAWEEHVDDQSSLSSSLGSKYSRYTSDDLDSLEENSALENIRFFVEHVATASNAGNLAKVNAIIDDCVAEDCEINTPGCSLRGKEHVKRYFDALLECFPDFVAVTRKSRLKSGNMFTSKVYFTGTKTFATDREYYFKPSECNAVELIISNSKRKLSESEIASLLKIQEAIRNNQKYIIWGRGYWNLKFDPSSMRIVRVEINDQITSFKTYHEEE